MPKEVELRALKDPVAYWDAIEKRMIEAFRKVIYGPLVKELFKIPQSKILNASDNKALYEALRSGRITYSDSSFKGKFNASISRELKGLGATWDKKSKSFVLPWHEIPSPVLMSIKESANYFEHVVGQISRKLERILPAEVVEAMPVRDLFEGSLWHIEKDFQKSVSKILVAPKLTKEQTDEVATAWSNNMDLWVKDFTVEQIKELRATVEKSVLSGNRYETLIEGIKTSYGVTQRKAKFLARQETHLMLAQFQETRYKAAGVNEYRWGCVKMPHDSSPSQHTPGNVRYYHGILEGQTFRWDDPPVTAKNPERRNNPGQDYNCRCFARPIVKF